MRTLLAALAAVLLLGAPLAPDALAQGNSGNAGKGKPAHAGKPDKDRGDGGERGGAYAEDGEISGSELLLGILTAAEKATIRDWYRTHTVSDLDALPPGIRMKVARGGTLPPGIAEKQLPGGLLSRLPSRPDHEYRRLGRDVVLVEKATGIVIDILRDAL